MRDTSKNGDSRQEERAAGTGAERCENGRHRESDDVDYTYS